MRYAIQIGFTTEADTEEEAQAKGEALVEYMIEDYGIVDGFVESVFDPTDVGDDED